LFSKSSIINKNLSLKELPSFKSTIPPIVKIKMSCETNFLKNVLDDHVATEMYNDLLNNIKWEDGIKSRKGFTRKAKSTRLGYDWGIDLAIYKALSQLAQYSYHIGEIYLNYYEDGNSWTPNHTHPGSHQMVISLGLREL